MQTFIALLRGINVGGHKKIKMAELRALCERLGFGNVRSYIQSGNLLLDSEEADTTMLEQRLKQGIAEEFGFDVPVLLLTRARLERTASSNPFVNERNEDIKALYVAFLQEEPGEEEVSALELPKGCSDEMVMSGTEVYLFYPHGAGRSKLTNNTLEKKLKVAATTRNWKTVQALLSRVGA